jgi:mannose-6-phosphate isomerase-like protein (cupin superfamily)
MLMARIALLASVSAIVAASSGPAASSPPGQVLHIERAAVEAAFSKGAVLVDGSSGRGYMVHASRREAPGIAEIHDLDTDILYVLEGSATFVTGGSVDDAKEIEPDERRGPSIAGGESRRIAKGDIVIVPPGVPHWFSEVTAPLLYYVVKVRS